jgi:hypothetical protein
VAFDYLFRTPIVAALARAGALPPANPFFYPGHPVPFRYHYFWFLLNSLPARLAPHLVTPRHALIAGTIWIGLGLMAAVILYLLFFERRANLRRVAPIAMLLLCVSGLDIIPVGALDLSVITIHKGPFYPTVDWWNTDQVTGWIDSVLWAPHDIAALIAFLTGILLLYLPRKCWRDMIAAAFAFASAAGMSVFVTLVFAAVLAVWFALRLWKRDFREAKALAAACAMAAALALPFLIELMSAGTPSHGFLKLGIRIFKPIHILHLPFEPALNLLVLPLNYFLEFGFFFAVAIWKWRQPRTSTDAPAVAVLAVSLIIATFVRSTTLEFNDLGARALLPAQFVLLLWSVDASAGIRRNRLLAATFALGLATSGYELLRLRSVLFLNDLSPVFAQTWISPDGHFGERDFALRQTYEWLDSHIPTDAIVQPNPEAFQEVYGGLYSNRQYALESIFFSNFGGNDAAFREYSARLPRIFHPGNDPVPICRELHIDVLVFKDIDPIWQDRSSWIWHHTPLYANDRSLAFPCAKIGNP